VICGRRPPGLRVEFLLRAHHQSCAVAALCPRDEQRTATEHMGRGNLHDAGSRRTCAAGDCLCRLFGRCVGDRAPGAGAKAPRACASPSGRGRTRARARGSRARQKLTFHRNCHLSSHADRVCSVKKPSRREFAHIRVLCPGDMPCVWALFDASRGRYKPIQTVNLHLRVPVGSIQRGNLVHAN
jgi:hypothetical protein